jgi:uncharacterized membrane protein
MKRLLAHARPDRLDRSQREVALPVRLSQPGARFLVYGLAGWAVDSVFVAVRTGRRRPSDLPNVPVYGLAQPLFEPLHDRLKQRRPVVRGAAYGFGIVVVEYATGRLLRRFLGRVPWDYSGARFAVDGLVRLDYLPLWGAFGLALERAHDLLVGTPSK